MAPDNALAAPAAAAPSNAGDGRAWASVIERLVRNLDRAGSKQWTPARRKDSLHQVLVTNRSDATRLQQRLSALLAAWEGDRPGGAAEPAEAAPAAPEPAADRPEPAAAAADSAAWPALVAALESTVRTALPAADTTAAALAAAIRTAAEAATREGATAAHAEALGGLCAQARALLAQRGRLVEHLHGLSLELAEGLTELAEEGSWARGQASRIQLALAADDGAAPSVRGVRAASALLTQTRQQQARVRAQRDDARESIKVLLQRMVGDAGEIGHEAGRFQQAIARHAQAVAGAGSLESLGQVVRSILDDSQAVQTAVARSRDRIEQDQAQVQALQAQVRELEGELKRLSDEVHTDALTQVANRRGLQAAFDVERARCERAGAGEAGGLGDLGIGLIDIDNFKKLNDSLGHAAGDQALKALAAAVRERLRPVDHVARFGGEEFVVLLPGQDAAAAAQALTRLQRSLSEALFMHEGRGVLVTFSAGVTPWRTGETLEQALERADGALYEAKRTGKNRTCTA
jgi:diguanylate cyclase